MDKGPAHPARGFFLRYNRRMAAPQNDRWFVRTEGHTFGPLPSSEVRTRLQSGEFLATDRICVGGSSAWLTLNEHPAAAHWISQSGSARDLAVLAPPHSLREKKTFQAPALPAVAETLPQPEATVVVEAAPVVPEPPRKRGRPRKHPAPTHPAKKPAKLKAERPQITPPQSRSFTRAMEEWSREEAFLRPAPPPSSPAQTPPSLQAHFPSRREASAKSRPADRALRIELVFPNFRSLLFLVGAVALLSAAFYYTKKMRDPGDSRLLDPSTPSLHPASMGDPIPPLQAPTRPQRE